MRTRSWASVLMVLLLSALGMTVSVRDTSAQGVPLSELAGTFSLRDTGYTALCFTGSPPSLAACSASGAFALQFNIAAVGTWTWDAAGNSCTTHTGVNGLYNGSTSTTSSTVRVSHFVATVTTYDSTTGTGDLSFTAYTGGGHCVGAIFDSTGATKLDFGTTHFAVSENGNRIDQVFTSITGTPVNFFGSSVVTFEAHRLLTDNQQQ